MSPACPKQNTDATPAIANVLESIDNCDTILVASPISNVQPPKIMSTFVEGLDFKGKTVLPITTHAMSGLDTTERDYARLCVGGSIGRGLVRGEGGQLRWSGRRSMAGSVDPRPPHSWALTPAGSELRFNAREARSAPVRSSDRARRSTPTAPREKPGSASGPSTSIRGFPVSAMRR